MLHFLFILLVDFIVDDEDFILHLAEDSLNGIPGFMVHFAAHIGFSIEASAFCSIFSGFLETCSFIVTLMFLVDGLETKVTFVLYEIVDLFK